MGFTVKNRFRFFLLYFLTVFLSGGFFRAAGELNWTVSLDRALGTAHVRGTIPVDVLGGTSQLDLIFPDLKNHPENMISLAATENGNSISISEPGDQSTIRRLNLKGVPGDIIIEYVIDPTYYPPGVENPVPEDSRSRIGENLAILRTTSFLPNLSLPETAIRVTFSLPPGWGPAVPWEERDGSYSLPDKVREGVDYLGLGPFRTGRFQTGDFHVLVAVHPEVGSLDVADVRNVIAWIVQRFGPPAESLDEGGRVVLVVPWSFMRGGAAGNSSLVAIPDPIVISHEVFHWWNGPGRTNQEAAWFREGFTNYFGTKAALETGFISQEAASACLADLFAEMRFLEKEGPVGLGEASRKARQSGRMSRLVYSKGTLLAYLQDKILSSHDEGLENVVRLVFTNRAEVLGNSALGGLIKKFSNGNLGKSFQDYVLGGKELPDMGFKSGTGKSGCARFLPAP